MRLTGFRADRLIDIALLPMTASGLGDLLFDWTDWPLPALLFLGPALLLIFRRGRLHWAAQVLVVAVAVLGGWPLLMMVIALAGAAWAVAILVGNRRSLNELREANDRLQAEYKELTERNLALADSAERFRIAFEHAPIGMAVVDLNGRFLQVNPAVRSMLGYSQEELLATTIRAITHPDDVNANYDRIKAVKTSQLNHYGMEKRYIHKNGRILWVDLNVSVVRDAQGNPLYLLGQILDITERKEFEAKLQEWASIDSLTGLHNRRRFMEEIHWAVALWKRYGTTGAVVLIDLDGFKAVNDTLGHAAGDELLRRIGQLLRREMRTTDLYARLGGDEFVCFLGAVDAQEATAVVERLLQSIAQLTESSEYRSVRVTGSAGIAMLPEHATEPEELLEKADMARYQAKRSGKNQAVVYGPESAAVFQAPLA